MTDKTLTWEQLWIRIAAGIVDGLPAPKRCDVVYHPGSQEADRYPYGLAGMDLANVADAERWARHLQPEPGTIDRKPGSDDQPRYSEHVRVGGWTIIVGGRGEAGEAEDADRVAADKVRAAASA